MPALLDLIRQAQALRAQPGSPVGAFVDSALEAVLLAEGPPPQPIDGYSEGLASQIVRSSAGRVRFLAHTWTTGPWSCLLLDLAPIPTGRPILLTDKVTGAHRVTVDYPSRKMQEQLRCACQSLELQSPSFPCRVASFFDSHRTFVAWTGYQEEVSVLKGDLDNYAKNILDGLQRGQLIRNDKSVASLLSMNYPMPSAKHTLDEFMRDQIQAHLEKHPAASPKTTARALNYPTQRTERAYKALAPVIARLRSQLIADHLRDNPHKTNPAQIAKATRLSIRTITSLMPTPVPAPNQAGRPPRPLPMPSQTPDKAPHSPLTSSIPQDLATPTPLLPIDKRLDDSNPDLLDQDTPQTASGCSL